MIKTSLFITNLHLTIFHINHFVIGNKQINSRIFLLYQISRKKLVPNYKTNSKNIFERKKRNGAITSPFGLIINLTNS